MKYCNKTFATREEQKKFVDACEHDFEVRLAGAVSEATHVEGLKVVELSGPTCSGKTTTANKLIDDFSASGRNVHIVSIDDFFKDNIKKQVVGDDIDLDSVNALDLDCFYRCAEDILAGRVARIPKFDFVSGRRAGHTEILPTPEDVYIFEGIQAVYPEITSAFSKINSRSIFICPRESVNVGGVVFEPNELRFMRRLVRDHNFRGASPEYTMYLWKSVRRNEDNSIFPYADACDIQIDSTMPYDVNVLSQFLRPLLTSVPVGEYRKIADELYEKIEGIEGIDTSLIPDGSLYYEFIKKQ